MNFPLAVFLISILALASSVRIGILLRTKRGELAEGAREDFGVILAGTLTLLGLIIGFSFSMGVSRYDQRKNYEEEEANAIGTEYVRADLLPPADAVRVRTLLRSYLDQRVLYYQTRTQSRVREIEATTERLQADLWSTVQVPAVSHPTPIVGLAVSGMNDVLNSEGYTQAAWWNRIPVAAWILMAFIGICCHILLGYGSRKSDAGNILFLAFPLVVSISFFLIADIDSPRGGVIRVRPENLIRLAHSLNPR